VDEETVGPGEQPVCPEHGADADEQDGGGGGGPQPEGSGVVPVLVSWGKYYNR
jgi:hypothetical protein